MDEWLNIDATQLLQEQCAGTTVINTQGYQMVAKSESPSLADLQLSGVHRGHKDFMYSKRVLFQTPAITDINYNPGAHGASPAGQVQLSATIYKLYHMKFLGLPYLLSNYRKGFARSHDDRKQELNVHWSDEEEEIRRLYEDAAALAGLPGYGGLQDGELPAGFRL